MKNKRAVYLVASDSAGTEIKVDVSEYVVAVDKNCKLFVGSIDYPMDLHDNESFISFFKIALHILKMKNIKGKDK